MIPLVADLPPLWTPPRPAIIRPADTRRAMFPFGMPLASDVDYSVALLHFDGANGATSTTDEKGHTVTLTSAQLSTAQAKFGASSLNVTAGTAGNGATVGSGSADFQFGTGDFTVETWVYATSFSGDPALVGIGADGTGLWLRATSGNLVIFWNAASNASGIAIPTSQWVWLAVSRLGATIYVYVNSGTPGYSFAASSFSHTSSTGMKVGGRGEGSAVASCVGYFDETRVLKGKGFSTMTVPAIPY